MEPRLLGVASAANYLSISVHYLYKLAERRQVQHVRMGRRLLFDVRDLDRLIEARKVRPVYDWARELERRR